MTICHEFYGILVKITQKNKKTNIFKTSNIKYTPIATISHNDQSGTAQPNWAQMEKKIGSRL